MAKAVTLTEMDVASAKAQVANLTTLGDVDDVPSGDHADQYWITSAGKFRFLLEELPNHLQLIYGFLKELYHVTRPDTQRHLLRCVEILCLHCEVLPTKIKIIKHFNYYYIFYINSKRFIQNNSKILGKYSI